MEHTGKRALVLAGGGAKGSYQIGVWRALQELDWTPDIITGASVGTLNGCLFTMGKIQEAEDLWRSLEIHDVLEVPATLKPEELRTFFLDIIRSGGLNVEPLAEMIDRLIDEDAVRTSPIHFGLVMTELGSLRSVQCPIEDIPEGQLKDYMLASSACFPALRPREIDGVKYIDGGWRDNMPLDLAAKMGAAELLGVDMDGIGIVRPNTTGLPTRIVRSHWDLGPTLDFDPARAGRNIALGYFDTLRLFGRCGGTAYAMLPDNEEFLARFAEQYQKLLAEVCARAPEIDLVEKNARLRANYPAPYAPNPSAPTRGALAPLELAAEHVGVPEDMPYTPKLLAATFMGSFDKDPADRFPALLDVPIVKAGTENDLVPLGTGPYVYTTAADGAALTANPHWQGSSLPLERIALAAVKDNDTALSRFASRSVHFLCLDPTGTGARTVGGAVESTDVPTAAMQYLGFNLSRTPLNDAAVRRAMSGVIDRGTLVSSLLSGHGTAAQLPIAPQDADYPKTYEYRTTAEEYAAALETAGVTAARPRSLTLLVNKENAFRCAVAESLCAQLTTAALTVTVRELPWGEYAAALEGGDFDLYLGEVRLTADWDAGALLDAGGALNYGGFASEQLSGLNDAFLLGGNASAERYVKGFAEETPFAPLLFKSKTVLTPSGLVDGMTPTASDPFYGFADWSFHLSGSES